MNHKISLLVGLFFISLGMNGQENLNKYKYVLVPKQYEFQKNPDSYQINSLHKFLFEKAGFEALFTDDIFPEDLKGDRCLALSTKVVSNPSMFKTRIKVQVFDCYNKLVYSSKEYSSREKNYKMAFNETLRNAMAEFAEMNHEYDSSSETAIAESPKEEVISKELAVVETEVMAAERTEEKVEEKAIEQVKSVEENKLKEEVKEPAKVLVPATTIVVAEEVATKEEKTKLAEETTVNSIEGSYSIDMWGVCKVVKKGDNYALIGGDEDFEFAQISPTSNPMIFMLKKTGFKEVQLLQLEANGDIKIDSGNGFKTYKRVD